MPYQTFHIDTTVGNGNQVDDEYRPDATEYPGVAMWESHNQMPWDITVYGTDAALDEIESVVRRQKDIGERVYPDPDPWA